MGCADKKNHSMTCFQNCQNHTTTANGSKNHSMTRCKNCQNHAMTANGSSPQASTYHGMLLEQKMAAKFRGNDGKIMCRSKRVCAIERD